jgi:hypothetical protein
MGVQPVTEPHITYMQPNGSHKTVESGVRGFKKKDFKKILDAIEKVIPASDPVGIEVASSLR